MNKFHWGLLPMLLTFGPLFGSGMGGMLYDEPSWTLRRVVPIVGALMTAAGLGLVIRFLRRQSRELANLSDEIRRLTDR